MRHSRFPSTRRLPQPAGAVGLLLLCYEGGGHPLSDEIIVGGGAMGIPRQLEARDASIPSGRGARRRREWPAAAGSPANLYLSKLPLLNDTRRKVRVPVRARRRSPGRDGGPFGCGHPLPDGTNSQTLSRHVVC